MMLIGSSLLKSVAITAASCDRLAIWWFRYAQTVFDMGWWRRRQTVEFVESAAVVVIPWRLVRSFLAFSSIGQLSVAPHPRLTPDPGGGILKLLLSSSEEASVYFLAAGFNTQKSGFLSNYHFQKADHRCPLRSLRSQLSFVLVLTGLGYLLVGQPMAKFAEMVFESHARLPSQVV